jgi:type II secretory pathway pseudopilin PulG
MIVSVGIFSIVMLVASGAYVKLVALDRQARATNDLVTNLSFATESMSRSIRTGTGYACTDPSDLTKDGNGNSTSGQCHQISFTDNNTGQPVSVTYRRNSTGTLGQCIGIASGSCNDSTAVVLTDSRVVIAAGGLDFYVRGVGANDGAQPWVTFTLTGTMPNGNTGNTLSFTIQSSATQRKTE